MTGLRNSYTHTEITACASSSPSHSLTSRLRPPSDVSRLTSLSSCASDLRTRGQTTRIYIASTETHNMSYLNSPPPRAFAIDTARSPCSSLVTRQQCFFASFAPPTVRQTTPLGRTPSARLHARHRSCCSPLPSQQPLRVARLERLDEYYCSSPSESHGSNAWMKA